MADGNINMSQQRAQFSLKNHWLKIVKRLLMKIKDNNLVKRLYKLAFFVIGKLPANEKLVIFESFNGKQYSCNPRAIFEYLRDNHPEYRLIWSISSDSQKLFEGKNIPYVKRFSLQWLFLMPRAKYWVINSRLPLWLYKPKHTTYLQTWHGTPLKKLALDMEEVHMPGTTTDKYKENFVLETSRWDFLISPNAYSTEIFQRAFQFKNETIESGYPRNDYLYNCNDKENIDTIKKTIGLPLDKKIILYAPTWRDDQFYSIGHYKFTLQLDLDQMKQQLGDEYIIILRMHYLVAENLDLTAYKDFAFDLSNYEDIRDLYLISDLLITDYSSVFFDYANLKRPIIFFVYDIDSYRDKLRGFYIDFENEAPGPLLKTSIEVVDSIQNIENVKVNFRERFDTFYRGFCQLEDGKASERVFNRVFK